MLSIEAPWQARIQQQNFRVLLEAMSRPGTLHTLIADDGNGIDVISSHRHSSGRQLLALLATLLDPQVSLADPDQLLASDDLLLLQAQSEPADTADFIVANGGNAPTFTPGLGELTAPEKSATLLVLASELSASDLSGADLSGADLSGADLSGVNPSLSKPTASTVALTLSGPGIVETNHLRVVGLHTDWWQQRQQWNQHFPLGVDVFLVAGNQLCALPRTCRVEWQVL